jgi:hypothetical protein
LDKIAGILLISLLAIVFAVSLSYYVVSQPNQTQNNPSPTPTASTTPSPTEEPTQPASTPELSVPEFTVKLVAYPYDVPTTYSTDPYNGETITHQGYHVENKSIEVRIKNQPFTPDTVAEGHEINLYYNVNIKGHFEESWTGSARYQASTSEYTIINLPESYPANATVDFQVDAILGYNTYHSLEGHPLAIFPAFEVVAVSYGNLQTITIP